MVGECEKAGEGDADSPAWTRQFERFDPELRPGLVLAIEPMVNSGSGDVKTLNDGWTVVTVDGGVSSHCEHTVAVTESGPRVLTLAPGESWPPERFPSD